MKNSTQLNDKMRLKSGFTLVELAIVIVVIGLLVGGVLQGNELIYQSKLRKALAQINEYKLAIETFRAKYDQLPGDMKNAKSFFPECKEQLPIYSCNGNGNGVIEEGDDPMVWRHLGLSGLLKGNYNISSSLVTLFITKSQSP